MTAFKWWDGKFIPHAQPVMDDNDHTLHYGDGVFEGEAAYPELDDHDQPTGRWHIVLGQQHGQRLLDGAATLGIPVNFTEPETTAAAAMLAGLNRLPESKRVYIRRLLTRGPGLGVNPDGCVSTLSIRTKPWDQPYLKAETMYRGGATCLITGRKRFRQDQLPGDVKATGAYLLGTLMKQEANRVGASEGLATDDKDHILDTSGSNVYAIRRDGIVVYPDPERSNILGGRTFHLLRSSCFRQLGIAHAVSPITLEGFRRGELVGAFLSGTAMEVVPWTMTMFVHPETKSLEQLPIGRGEVHELVVAIRNWYAKFKHGQLPDLRDPEYLTPVPCDREIAELRRRLSSRSIPRAA